MMDKVRIVFDRYDIPNSLKEATRIWRKGMQTPVEYHITDTSNIAKISQAKLLPHPKTKHQFTSYLGQALLDDASSNGHHVVVAWGTRCKANISDKADMSSEQEKADTKHAKDAVDCEATNIYIFSPDTNYHLHQLLLNKQFFVLITRPWYGTMTLLLTLTFPLLRDMGGHLRSMDGRLS